MSVNVRTTALVAALAGLGVIAAPAQALAPSGGTITQITVTPQGETAANGNGRQGPVVSNDGRYVAYWSYSPSIVAGDNNGLADVFLHDTTTGVTTLVSRNAQGGSANNGSSIPAISANGKYVAFHSAATNLAGAAYPGDTVGELIYRYSVANGRIKLVSKTPNDAIPSNFATMGAISATGRYIAYTSRAHNIVPGDHNGVQDVFRYDFTTDTTIKVSQAPGGLETDKYSYAGAISGNGRYIAWTTKAENMGPADTNNDDDAYLFDAETGTSTLVSHNSSGQAVGGRATGISDNGKIVTLTSNSDSLAPGDTDENEGAFVYSAATDQVKLISTARPEWAAGVFAATTSISANGRYIAFVAFPLANPSNSQAYLYDRQTRQSVALGVKPDGSAANGGSGDPNVSRSGNYVGFCSAATDLVAGDNNADTCDIFLWSRTLG